MQRSALQSGKKGVLFVCIGNSCRSQMAEAFARAYGSDVLEARSAGLAPASIVQPLTHKVMQAKNLSLEGQFPKDLLMAGAGDCDIVVNLSGLPLPGGFPAQVIQWKVEDPIGAGEEKYCQVRDQIENLVMGLILQLRRESSPPPPPPARTPRPNR